MLPLLLTIGTLYVFALGAGRLSAAVGIPRVTGYLVLGLAAGPQTAAVLGCPLSSPRRSLPAWLYSVR